ncbi:MAG: outer membrane beta-barrel protein [Paludibacteraceae bacterium]|nr:outer membrane beta-barrel protein [Paludibacteraceae bacterium]
MRRIVSAIWILLGVFPLFAIAEDSIATRPVVSGNIHVGASTDMSSECDQLDYRYTTLDKRLGSNSGHHYFSDIDDVNHNVRFLYDASLVLNIRPEHALTFSLQGDYDWERTIGTRAEMIHDKDGNLLSRVYGQYDYPRNVGYDIHAGLTYTYRMRRQGESLAIGYCYDRGHTSQILEQKVNEAMGWTLFTTNHLEQQNLQQCHHAHIDYVCPIAKGHAIDMGIVYHRRQIDVQTAQEWDAVSHLNSRYLHLTQYGALYARYRLQLGAVQASAQLEYDATKMQRRWLHDVVPAASLRYQIDSVHSLTAQYKMLLIRPEASHLDTNVIMDAFEQSFGVDSLVGTHVHNTSLMYQMALPRITFAATLRYITANDGLNALWMERNDRRIYTWGNEGIRHAVGLTPMVDTRLGSTTQLHVDATLLWDKRVAEAIQMSNANWGIAASVRCEQQLPYAMALVFKGDYAYHNTLDLYSYAGHGGSVGAAFRVAFLKEHNLCLNVGYTCTFMPEVHIAQGAYMGTMLYHPGCIHTAELHLSYDF